MSKAEERERWEAWEQRRCCCVLPDARACIQDRYGLTANEVELPMERCECGCHAVLASEDDRDWWTDA